MAERPHRLACPVCLGSTMARVAVGSSPRLEVDLCQRCGGMWLERGEVQGLRSQKRAPLQRYVENLNLTRIARCHYCHEPLGRAEEQCAACGGANVLDCPACDRPMQVEVHGGLRLDICRSCEGAWFDHDEIEAIWGPSFDRSLERRNLTRGKAAVGAVEAGGDVLLHTLFYAPDLVYLGASAAGHLASAAGSALPKVPEVLTAAPEVAGSAFEAVGEAAGTVFEVVVEIVGGIFG